VTVAVEHAVSAREGAEAKGRRYLVEGRLTVSRVDREGVRASCRGAGAVYECGWSAERGWFCSCAARGRCAHLVALMLVVVRSEAA
jgi:uncharacterized Zn finger protein